MSPRPPLRSSARPADVLSCADARSIMGGTFMSMPESYRHSFIAGLHNALSGFTGTDVDEAVRFSEQSKTKCVGITIETRPDYCLRPHLRYDPSPSLPGMRLCRRII
jgi:hypothetical protein